MKILIVSHSCGISGGANRSLLSVIDGLINRHSAEISVLVMKDHGAFIDELKKRQVHILVFPYHSICTRLDGGVKDLIRYIRLYFFIFLDWINAIQYTRELSQYSFDLVYTNTRLIFFGGFLAKRLHIPHVWHIREYGKENGGYSVFFSNKLIEKLSSRVIFISNDLKNTFKKYTGINGVCIYNGIPKKKQIEKKKHDGINLLLTGRLVREKGQKQAIDAICLLSDTTREKITLYLAGSGDDKSKYVNELHEIVKQRKMPVIFCGEVKDMDDLRSIIDIELMCADREAFGRVTIEALMCGIPVIGANTGATPEIVQNEINGLVYDKNKTENLSKCIEKLVEDNALRALLSDKAMQYEMDKYSITKCVDSIYQEFVDVCN